MFALLHSPLTKEAEVGQVIEFRIEAVIELAKEAILLVKEMAREHRVKAQVEGTQEAITLAREVHLRKLQLEKMRLDFMLAEARPKHEKMFPEQKEVLQRELEKRREQSQRDHAAAQKQREARKFPPKVAQGNRSNQVRETLKEGTRPVEGAVMEKQNSGAPPLTHKFPDLTELQKKP